jgi:hypothetical protein
MGNSWNEAGLCNHACPTATVNSTKVSARHPIDLVEQLSSKTFGGSRFECYI